MNLDTQLRDMMQNLAHYATVDPDVLDQVRRRDQRFRRTRRTVLAAVSAATVLAVPLAAGLLPAGPGTPTLIQPPLVLRPATPEQAPQPFPYEFTWLPAGRHHVSISWTGATATASLQIEGGHAKVTVGTVPFENVPSNGHELTTSVNGVDATLRIGSVPDDDASFAALTWPAGGRWVTIEGHNRAGQSEVVNIAQGMRPGRTEVEVPISLRWAPAGWVTSGVTHGHAISETLESVELFLFINCLGDPASVSDPDRRLCVQMSLAKEPAESYAGFELVIVNGKTAWLAQPDRTGSRRLVFELGDWRLTIVQGRQTSLSVADLITFAEGVSMAR